MKYFIIIAAMLCAAGCAHEQVIRGGSETPEIEILPDNTVLWRGHSVNPDDLPKLLKSADVAREETVFIRIPSGHDKNSLRMQYYVCAKLTSNGYRRPILVQKKETRSEVMSGKHSAPAPRQQQTIRYK